MSIHNILTNQGLYPGRCYMAIKQASNWVSALYTITHTHTCAHCIMMYIYRSTEHNKSVPLWNLCNYKTTGVAGRANITLQTDIRFSVQIIFVYNEKLSTVIQTAICQWNVCMVFTEYHCFHQNCMYHSIGTYSKQNYSNYVKLIILWKKMNIGYLCFTFKSSNKQINKQIFWSYSYKLINKHSAINNVYTGSTYHTGSRKWTVIMKIH